MPDDEIEHLRTLLAAIHNRVEEERTYLTELDSNIGDADFGSNLHRGTTASIEAVEQLEDPSIEEFVATVGETLMDTIAGSSGILFGMSLVTASTELADGITLSTAASFAEAYTGQVAERGDVEIGSKTMYDVLVPVVDVLRAAVEQGRSPVEASARAVEAARRGVMYTAPLRAKRGRASYTEWNSVGHPDPGAMGTYILLQEIHTAVEEACGESVRPGLGDGLDSGPSSTPED